MDGANNLQSMGTQSTTSLKDHTKEEWEAHREAFTQYYVTEDRSLQEVKMLMESRHQFRAT
jgi:hypothetical protein